MRHQSMATAAQESDLAQEVFLPIPANALRPVHSVVVISAAAMKMKFEELRRAAGLAGTTEVKDKSSTKL
jgi:hypothetical protein